MPPVSASFPTRLAGGLLLALGVLALQLPLHGQEADANAEQTEAGGEKKDKTPTTAQDIPLQSPGFSFSTASSGKVEDFAVGESPAELQARHQRSMLRRYDRDGDGKLSHPEKTRQMNDHYVHLKRLIAQYDKNGNRQLDPHESYLMQYTIYLQRLNFMKLYDENQDGYLDSTETQRMRRELERRQEYFLRNIDR